MHLGMTTAIHASDAQFNLYLMHEGLVYGKQSKYSSLLTCPASTILIRMMHQMLTLTYNVVP